MSLNWRTSFSLHVFLFKYLHYIILFHELHVWARMVKPLHFSGISYQWFHLELNQTLTSCTPKELETHSFSQFYRNTNNGGASINTSLHYNKITYKYMKYEHQRLKTFVFLKMGYDKKKKIPLQYWFLIFNIYMHVLPYNPYPFIFEECCSETLTVLSSNAWTWLHQCTKQ